MKRLSWFVAAAALTISGCASAHQSVAQRIVTVEGPDRSWSVEVTVRSSQVGFCEFGPIQFSNGAGAALGGTVAIVVSNEARTLTLGEVIASCATAFPGGRSQCVPDRRIAYVCRDAIITARPLALR